MAISPFSRSRRGDDGDDTASTVFLGSLRSEFDEEVPLHPAFSTLLAASGAVRGAYLNGRLGGEDAAAAFAELRLVGSDGAEWTIGATSGRWYRRVTGGSWVPADVPAELAASDAASPRWLTESVSVLLEGRTRPETPAAAPDRVVERPVLPLPELPDPDEEVDWLLSQWKDDDEQAAHRRTVLPAAGGAAEPAGDGDGDGRSGEPLPERSDTVNWVAPEKYWWRDDDALTEELADIKVVGDVLGQTGAGLPAEFPDDVGVRDLTARPPDAPVVRQDAFDQTDLHGWQPVPRVETAPDDDDDLFDWAFGDTARPGEAAADSSDGDAETGAGPGDEPGDGDETGESDDPYLV